MCEKKKMFFAHQFGKIVALIFCPKMLFPTKLSILLQPWNVFNPLCFNKSTQNQKWLSQYFQIDSKKSAFLTYSTLLSPLNRFRVYSQIWGQFQVQTIWNLDVKYKIMLWKREIRGKKYENNPWNWKKLEKK